jgi:cytochrome c biogenesis protein CcdA
MVLFVLIVALLAGAVIMLSPLLLPGAAVVLVVLGAADVYRKHHVRHAARPH